MSVAEQIFLSAIIAAFLFFGITLFSVYLWAGKAAKGAKPGLKPVGLAAIALVVSLAGGAVLAQAAGQAAATPAAPQLNAAR